MYQTPKMKILRKKLTVFNHLLFLQKYSMLDVWQGSEYISSAYFKRNYFHGFYRFFYERIDIDEDLEEDVVAPIESYLKIIHGSYILWGVTSRET